MVSGRDRAAAGTTLTVGLLELKRLLTHVALERPVCRMMAWLSEGAAPPLILYNSWMWWSECCEAGRGGWEHQPQGQLCHGAIIGATSCADGIHWWFQANSREYLIIHRLTTPCAACCIRGDASSEGG